MNGQKGLVSIIIPVYNSEKYLEATLESVQRQTYTNIEVLLIDDGSTDLSPGICDTFAEGDPRFRVIHQKNKGPSAARNRGITESKGEFLTFVDNDDLLHKDFVRILYELCRDNECDIALTKSFPFLDEEVIPYGEPEVHLTFMDKRELSANLLDMRWTGLAITMAKIFHRRLFAKIRFNENRIIADDDSSIYLLYWTSEKSVLFHAPLYFYRSRRKGSITHSKYELSWLTGVDAFRERMDFYHAQKEMVLYAKAMRSYCRKMSENYLQIRKNFPDEKGLLQELRDEMRKVSIKMFLLKGNSFSQKISAVMFAYIPCVWGKIYARVKGKM